MPAPPETVPGDFGPAALRTFFNIADAWHLTPEEAQAILGANRRTYNRWRRKPAKQVQLPQDTLERISYVLGIWKALRLIYTEDTVGSTWLRRHNDAPPFNGMRPLELMRAGRVADLFVVRQHLDARWGDA